MFSEYDVRQPDVVFFGFAPAGHVHAAEAWILCAGHAAPDAGSPPA